MAAPPRPRRPTPLLLQAPGGNIIFSADALLHQYRAPAPAPPLPGTMGCKAPEPNAPPQTDPADDELRTALPFLQQRRWLSPLLGQLMGTGPA